MPGPDFRRSSDVLAPASARALGDLVPRLKALPSKLSSNQVTLLKRLTLDQDFRTDFFDSPIDAVAKSGIKLSPTELTHLEKLNPGVYDALQGYLRQPGVVSSDGTNTLVYAVVLAVVVALLIAMPNPESDIGIENF